MRLSDTEWTVMQAVWTAGPTTARAVHGQVADSTEWTYSTVRTLLTRLVEKGALSARKLGQTTEYTALVSQESAQRSALRSLLERAFGGHVGPMVQHLVSDKNLSPKDREQLQRLLEEEESP